MCDELGDRLGLAQALRGLGKAYMHHGDLAKARDAIRRAVDIFAAARSKAHLGAALRTLGEITAAGGWGSAHTRSAREYFARAVAIVTAAKAKGEGDFVTDVACELPLQAIADLVGFPQEDRKRIFDWTNQMVAYDDPEFEVDPAVARAVDSGMLARRMPRSLAQPLRGVA